MQRHIIPKNENQRVSVRKPSLTLHERVSLGLQKKVFLKTKYMSFSTGQQNCMCQLGVHNKHLCQESQILLFLDSWVNLSLAFGFEKLNLSN